MSDVGIGEATVDMGGLRVSWDVVLTLETLEKPKKA